MYVYITELEFFDCGTANIASTDGFTPEQIIYPARTQVWHPTPSSVFRGFPMKKTHPFFKQKSLILKAIKTPFFTAKHALFSLCKI